MPELIPVLSQEEIDSKIEVVARKISKDYEGSELILIGVLKGSFIFLADLSRKISIPVKVEFIGASSYGDGTSTSGIVRITKDIDVDLSGKDVLFVEDIVDSGVTLSHLIEHINRMGPKSVKVCALLSKQERRRNNVTVDYACHSIPEGFLVGYGLDYAEDYRNLPAIYHLKL